MVAANTATRRSIIRYKARVRRRASTEPAMVIGNITLRKYVKKYPDSGLKLWAELVGNYTKDRNFTIIYKGNLSDIRNKIHTK